jgi:ATP-dependent RNA helicase DDX52/ROK1
MKFCGRNFVWLDSMEDDAFALLRTGTSFDGNFPRKDVHTLKGDAVDVHPDLDFFSDTPKQDIQIDEGTESSRNLKRTHSEIADFEPQQLKKRYRINVIGKSSPDPISSFKELAKHPKSEYLLENISHLGFTTPTPIQMQAIPIILEQKDLLACAPTGSGKTLSYLIPILLNLKSHLSRGFRAVIISPTRELAQQVCLSNNLLM